MISKVEWEKSVARKLQNIAHITATKVTGISNRDLGFYDQKEHHFGEISVKQQTAHIHQRKVRGRY